MCRRITGAARVQCVIYQLIRGAKILERNALTACYTHGDIAPGGGVSVLLVGTYGFPQVDEYVIQNSSAILFLAKSDVQTGVGKKRCEAVWSFVAEPIVSGDMN